MEKEKLLNKYNKNKEKYEIIHQKIMPYAIYFPQFHEIEENNVNFYKGFTDMVNLMKAKENNDYLKTPLLGYYDLVKDPDIINKQILMAKSYGFCGFGLYYYWFSDNNITNQNMIFDKVINRFFEDDLENFDVFFIYANENWTDNPHFSNSNKETKYIISNVFNEKNITNHFSSLLKYFKQKNYKKINNKPIFLLHHVHLMKKEEIKLFYNIGNKMLIDNGFNGLELIFNSSKIKYNNFMSYVHHYSPRANPFIIKFDNGFRCFDYKKYVKEFMGSFIGDDETNINTIFVNFDNTARMYEHKNKIAIIKTINNNIDLFNEFIDIQFKKYYKKDNDIAKIFLVNAWNEWGEDMSIEPSNEEGFLYLKNIKHKLIQHFYA